MEKKTLSEKLDQLKTEFDDKMIEYTNFVEENKNNIFDPEIKSSLKSKWDLIESIDTQIKEITTLLSQNLSDEPQEDEQDDPFCDSEQNKDNTAKVEKCDNLGSICCNGDSVHTGKVEHNIIEFDSFTDLIKYEIENDIRLKIFKIKGVKVL